MNDLDNIMLLVEQLDHQIEEIHSAVAAAVAFAVVTLLLCLVLFIKLVF